MIITLKDTTSHEIASRIMNLHGDRGAATPRRVLTLVVVIPDLIDVDRAIEISDTASYEHPCRITMVVDPPDTEGAAQLSVQIRVGDVAGPSNVTILKPRGQATSALNTLVMSLLLSDTPVTTYWLVAALYNPGEYPFDRTAIRRTADSRSSECPLETLLGLSQHYTPGNADLGQVGVTLWRALLATIAAKLDQMPVSVLVGGHETHPSSYLIAAWAHRMLGVPVTRQTDPHASTITGVHFYFAHDSQVSLQRQASSNVAYLHHGGLAIADVNLPKRSVQDCLVEELHRLDPDMPYGELLTRDLYLLPKAAERIAQ